MIMTERQLKLKNDMQRLVDKFCSDTGTIPHMRVGHRGYYVEFDGVGMASHLQGMLKKKVVGGKQ